MSLPPFVEGFKLSGVPKIDFTKGDLEEKPSSENPLVGSTKNKEPPIYIEFEGNDPRNPMNASRVSKWMLTIVACCSSVLSSSAGSSFSMGIPSMRRDLNCSAEQAALALGIFCLGLGIVPLFTAAFSEEVGRRPVFIVSSIIFSLAHLMSALSENIATVIISRFISGAAASTSAIMVSGLITDVWGYSERGLPMSIFSLCVIGLTSLGPVYSGWIEQNERLQWRWIQWPHFIFSVAYVLLVIVALRETRVEVLLTREAKKLRRQTGDDRYRARVEDENPSFKHLMFISCTRPIYLLFTEPVVLSFSLWAGLAWGILYSQLESIPIIFRTLYHFSDSQVGLAFLPMCIGSLVGFLLNLCQERLYLRKVGRRGPEARLYSAMVGSILFPIGCFIYGWTAIGSIHSWVGPMVGIFVFITSLFIIYLAVFTYLADTYTVYASSAMAGQNLCRNMMGTIFPLFTNQMYDRLTFRWASMLFGIIAAVMAIIPFILFAYGPAIRARSRFARNLALKEAQKELLMS